MDVYSGKRAGDGLVVSRKPSNLVLRETRNNREINSQICSRTGCSGRSNSAVIAQTGKPKTLRASVRPSCGGKTTIIGSSSRTSTVVNSPRKSTALPRRKLSSHLESDSSETSSLQDDPEPSERVSPPGKIQRPLIRESRNAESSGVSSMDVGSSSVASNTRSHRTLNQRNGLASRANLARPSSSSEAGSTSTSAKANASTARYGLKNMRCSSISDIVPSNCSSSGSSFGRRNETARKRNSLGESSSATRGKKINGSASTEQNPSSNSLSISDSRRSRYMPPTRHNDVPSVRPQRPIVSQTRARISDQGSGSRSSRTISQRSYPALSIGTSSTSSSHLSSEESPLVHPTSRGRSAMIGENIRGAFTSGMSQGFSRSLGNRDGLRRFNIDGIAEVLLALERIENDEELSFEQLLALETNLFPHGLNLYDQHRDMRLDIDNMSYEELLALEERMGNVSTALSEDALSECLTKSVYESTGSCVSGSGDSNEVKCSVCQEEYVEGDRIAGLRCDHGYHADCIQQLSLIHI